MINLSCDRCKNASQPVVYHPTDYVAADLCEGCYLQYFALKRMQEDRTFETLTKWLSLEDVGPIDTMDDWFYRHCGEIFTDEKGLKIVRAKVGL